MIYIYIYIYIYITETQHKLVFDALIEDKESVKHRDVAGHTAVYHATNAFVDEKTLEVSV